MKSTLAIGFSVSGLTGYLSHQEMMRLFQRCFIRAGLNLWFSRGFNPRPKMTIPLPRPVGVNSLAEIICVSIEQDENENFDSDETTRKLQKQLPEGVKIETLECCPGKKTFLPQSVEYVISPKTECFDETVKTRVTAAAQTVKSGGPLPIRRTNPAKNIDKQLNAADYINSIETGNGEIVFDCSVTQSGSLRVDEMMELAGLKPEELAGPILRRSVRWTTK
ncbi:radical SAM-linked protein [Limihaloglobus sulfuriphilus]|uniref:Radical SAM-linked protein n=1 Tax=Limihaloglobus sulfuriphilus TaxID=1851148 RepID=A0A1R7T5W1_9BACT|nr:TIGR03936 family radical SAM-associated protein [Limihaloglobus sulfuriphilus]AQQ71873.1 radical SAM-linked protein [Limihaloglobus sulfuriphilus]